MKKIIKFNTIKTDFLLCRIIQDYRVENYVQEMLNDILLFGLFMPIEICEV